MQPHTPNQRCQSNTKAQQGPKDTAGVHFRVARPVPPGSELPWLPGQPRAENRKEENAAQALWLCATAPVAPNGRVAQRLN